MKKAIVLSTLLLFLGISLNATEGNLFSYDKSKVTTEMKTLDALESYVLDNQGVTYDELQAAESPLVDDVSIVSGPLGGSARTPWGIPSFVWGFCLSWVGVLIVYLVTESRSETLNALWGMLAAIALGIIINVVIWIVWGSLWWSASGI